MFLLTSLVGMSKRGWFLLRTVLRNAHLWNIFESHFKFIFLIGTSLLAHHLVVVGYLEVTATRHWQMHSFSLIPISGSFSIFTTFVTIQHRPFLDLGGGHIVHRLWIVKGAWVCRRTEAYSRIVPHCWLKGLYAKLGHRNAHFKVFNSGIFMRSRLHFSTFNQILIERRKVVKKLVFGAKTSRVNLFLVHL